MTLQLHDNIAHLLENNMMKMMEGHQTLNYRFTRKESRILRQGMLIICSPTDGGKATLAFMTIVLKHGSVRTPVGQQPFECHFERLFPMNHSCQRSLSTLTVA